MLGSYEALTLTDASMAVGTGANAIGEAIAGNNDTVYMGSGSTGNLYGSGNTVQFTGNSGDYIGLHGQNETVTNDSGSDYVQLVDTGTSATISGGGSTAMLGSYEALTLTDAGMAVGTGANAIGEAIAGNNDTVYMGSGSTGNLYGSGDRVQFTGNSSDYIGLHGQNETVTNDSGSDYVQLVDTGTSATISGGGSTAMLGSYEALTLTDAGMAVGTGANAIGEAINANNDTVYMGSGSTGNLYGSGNTVQFTGNSGDYIGLHGQNETVTNDSGSDYVNLVDAGTSATVSGGGNIGLTASNETLSLGDSGSSVQTDAGLQNETINASGVTITLAGNVQVTINGSNDTISGAAGQDNITINGSNDHFSGNDDSVNFEGNIASDTDTGTSDSYFFNGGYVGGTDGSGDFDGPGGSDDDDEWDPLVLNLQGGAVQTVDPTQSPARFDFRGNGTARKTGWGTAGEGYLVDAVGGRNTVMSAADLVSSFASLQALDSNHDDRIDASDAQWSNLKVWVDDTGTATFQAGSLRSLSDLGITAINLDPTPDRHLQNGNMILTDGTFTRSDGSTGHIADVDFHVVPDLSQQVQAGTTGGVTHAQIATQAAQLVSAMSTFGTASAADTSTPGIDRPIHIPLTVDPTASSHRQAA